MIVWGLLIVAVVALAASALFSGAETGVYCASHLRLVLGARAKEPAALRLSRVLEDRQAAVATTLVGTNIANYIVTTVVAYLLVERVGLADGQAELYTVAILTPIVFVFGEVVPKTLFQHYADELLSRFSRPLAATFDLLRLTGLVWCHRLMTDLVTRIASGDSADRAGYDPKQRMAMMLHEALAGQTAGDDRSHLIDQIMQLSETPLHVMMIPRNRVTSIPAGADRREFMRVARRSPHTRLPVHDTHARHIVGMVHVDKLLRRDDWTTIGDRMEPPVTVSPHATVAAAINRMQSAHRDMAVVNDARGRLLGIVTLKDLLDTVLGEVVTDD